MDAPPFCRPSRTTWQLFASLGLGLMISGACSPESQSPRSASAATTRARRSTAEQAATKSDRHVDVDGDGNLDSVELERVHVDDAKQEAVWTLRASTGSTEDAIALLAQRTGNAWFGSTDLDNSPGAEIVLRSAEGAHAQFFAVFTWRNGSFVELPSPPIAGRTVSSARWMVDGAYNSAVGVTCGSGSGVNQLTLVSVAPLDPNDELLVGSSTVWTGGDAGWQRVRSIDVAMTRNSQDEQAAVGWHCPGLPNY